MCFVPGTLGGPPWPGLPPGPGGEGHYFMVEKNFVEMMACLALVFLPTGHWVGLDADLCGKRRHARELRRAEREGREHAAGVGRTAH